MLSVLERHSTGTRGVLAGFFRGTKYLGVLRGTPRALEGCSAVGYGYERVLVRVLEGYPRGTEACSWGTLVYSGCSMGTLGLLD